MTSPGQKLILIFHSEGNFHQNSTLWNLLNSLTGAGLEVHIVSNSKPLNRSDQPGVINHARSYGVRKLSFLLLNWLPSPLLLRLFFFILHRFVPLGRPRAIIGVDREGIIEAREYAQSFPSPLFFLSFEIMFVEETSQVYKRPEIEACREIDHAFIQDSVRAELLSKENGLDLSKFSLIPVAPKGLGKSVAPRVRDQLGIPRNKKVALIFGSIADWGASSEIVATVSEWPTDWVLLVHSRSPAGPELLALVKSFAERRVFFSLNSYNSVDDLGHLLSGIDAGLAFYTPNHTSRYTGENIRRIGLASGKIATYLSFGIPVVTNAKFGYDSLIPEYSAGIFVECPTRIPGALVQLDEGMSQGALRLFSEKLDYALFEGEVVGELLGEKTGSTE